jgi:hypothetical protein
MVKGFAAACVIGLAINEIAKVAPRAAAIGVNFLSLDISSSPLKLLTKFPEYQYDRGS